MLITLKHLQGIHGSAVQHFRLAEVAMLKNKEVDEESARTIWNGLGISYNSLGEPDKVSPTNIYILFVRLRSILNYILHLHVPF